MSKDREDKFDPTRPTLVVKYGAATRRHRPLDRDVMVLGRSAGCDVGLEAPDVAPVHCVIVRALDGWHVRDCTGRGATRLNGCSVQDAVLTDEDVLQVGSFSVALHLPPDHRPPADAPPPDGQALRHARRSRHNLARLALRLREKAATATEQAEKDLAARREALDRQAEDLQRLQGDLDGRLAELKRTAQEAAAEKLALQERRAEVETELAEKRAEAEAAARAREEAVHEASRILDLRARELSFYADHLRGLRCRLNEHEDSLAARWEEWLREQQEASLANAQQAEKTAREEATLREQRAEVVRLMGEMRQVRQPTEPPAEALRAENEQLRRDLDAAREEAKNFRDAGIHRFHVELDTGRRMLDEQIRGVQERFAELEQAAHEAELHIARERGRIALEREELERLRGGLWSGDGPAPTGETLVDMPSPLRNLAGAADAVAPSQAALSE